MPLTCPPAIPYTSVCRGLLLPADPVILGAVAGQLYELTLPETWEAMEGLTVSVAEITALFERVFDDYVSGMGCP